MSKAIVMQMVLTIKTDLRQPYSLSIIRVREPRPDPKYIPKLKTLFARLSICVFPKYELFKLMAIGIQPGKKNANMIRDIRI